MSMAGNINAAIIGSKQQINEQIMRISSFQKSNEEAVQKVMGALQGSTRNHDTKLLAQLEKTNVELKKALDLLQQADMALLQASQHI